MLRFTACTVAYPDPRSGPVTPVFADLSLTVAPGETLAVVGASGCGKTTLLYSAAGLLEPGGGTVTLDERRVAGGDRRVGLVLQQYGLFPWFTVRENVALGLRLHGASPERSGKAADSALEAVGMAELARRSILTLSGGEQQRVALARTWAMQPDLLLMDEPFSALDALTREDLQNLVHTLLRERPVAAILVTHSMEEAVLLGTRIAIMHGSPAQLTETPNPVSSAAPSQLRTRDDFFHTVAALRRRFEELGRA
ncbi:MAG: ATP-binding cassette domain-containing protein [Spirochaetaceae bacterium]|nr:MAG: ATP-binding cassette domain-containing protein [Spirochaetaceae bacterium]